MPRRLDVLVGATATNAIFTGAGTTRLVEANNGAMYYFYIDTLNDVVFKKSTDRGLTWSNATALNGQTTTNMALWYDRWSGLSSDLIHVISVDNTAADIVYRSVDTASSDALGTQTVVFAGASRADGGGLSIVRTRGGNLIVAGSIDAGAEDGAWESTDVGATWGSTIADPSEASTTDQYLLLPGWNADTQDAQLIFWDASADELSVKRYDDSANSWTETVIATGMIDENPIFTYPHLSAFVDIANSQNVVAAWSDVDTLNSDLRIWKITDSSITEMTAIVTNSVDDQGLVSITLDTVTGAWYAFYGGKTDGSETFATAINIYCKVSYDGGTTWSDEAPITSSVAPRRWLSTSPRIALPQHRSLVAWNNDTIVDEQYINTDIIQPRAVFQIAL
jgi:hypothetical protein